MADAIVTTVAEFLGAKGHEGAQTRMYLDSVGLQTVGVGWLIPNQAACGNFQWSPSVDAAKADWQNLEDWKKANPDKIPSLGPAARPVAVSATLTEEYMKAKTLSMIEGKRSKLKTWAEFKDFDSFPPDIRVAILVRAWGPFSKTACPKFIAACGRKDWLAAKNEINYAPKNVDAGRNPAMQKMMQNGINQHVDQTLNGKDISPRPSYPGDYFIQKSWSEPAKAVQRLFGAGRQTDWTALLTELNKCTMTEILSLLDEQPGDRLSQLARNLDYAGRHISRPRIRFALQCIRDRSAPGDILDPEKDKGQFEEAKRYLSRVPGSPRQIEF